MATRHRFSMIALSCGQPTLPRNLFIAASFVTGGAIAAAAGLLFPKNQIQAVAGYSRQQQDIQHIHSRHPTWYTTSATSHATTHCKITTPTVLLREPSSRRMVATAAMQGV